MVVSFIFLFTPCLRHGFEDDKEGILEQASTVRKAAGGGGVEDDSSGDLESEAADGIIGLITRLKLDAFTF